MRKYIALAAIVIMAFCVGKNLGEVAPQKKIEACLEVIASQKRLIDANDRLISTLEESVALRDRMVAALKAREQSNMVLEFEPAKKAEVSFGSDANGEDFLILIPSGNSFAYCMPLRDHEKADGTFEDFDRTKPTRTSDGRAFSVRESSEFFRMITPDDRAEMLKALKIRAGK